MQEWLLTQDRSQGWNRFLRNHLLAPGVHVLAGLVEPHSVVARGTVREGLAVSPSSVFIFTLEELPRF